jgi:dephospho-CoA kinase
LTGMDFGDRLAGVEKINTKPVIGILGGIGSGKSTTAAEFERLGCGLIDADKIAHELLDEPNIKKKVIEAFGSSILDTDNKINRKKLAEIVFADESKIRQLNSIIHPAVLARAEELIEELNSQPDVKAIVLDMPLLLEVGWEKMCERIIFIDCEAEKRAERSKKKHLFDENQLKIRENLQISLDKKQAIAENTIDNNSELSSLKKQVAEIFSNIVER